MRERSLSEARHRRWMEGRDESLWPRAPKPQFESPTVGSAVAAGHANHRPGLRGGDAGNTKGPALKELVQPQHSEQSPSAPEDQARELA